MQVLETSRRRLTLEDRPVALAVVLTVVILFLLALIFATWGTSGWLTLGLTLATALFGAALVLFVRRVQVTFDRDAGTVLIRTASLLGQSETTHPLARLSRASVETMISHSTPSNGGRSTTSRTHRTVLHIGEDVVPLTLTYSAGDGAERIAAAINDWLAQ